MPIVSVYQCPRCSKKWGMDKKSNYIQHLRHHVSRDRFKSIWEEVETANAVFVAKMKMVGGYRDFVKTVREASPLIFYIDFFFDVKERSNINLVRKLEFYRGKTISDIFPDKVTWSSMKQAGYSPRDSKTIFNISFGAGELYLANDFISRNIDSSFTLGLSVDSDGTVRLSANILGDSYYSATATKAVYATMIAMSKLKE